MSEADLPLSNVPEFGAPVVLSAEFSTADFECGESELDVFLQQSALNRQKAMLSRTYVCLTGTQDAPQVVGYYTLAHVQLQAAGMPSKLARGMPSTMPAILMARLAVDRRFQGRGLGESLLADALIRTWSVVESGAAPVRFFVVDAKHEGAKRFYLRAGMQPLTQDSLRLYLTYKQIQTALQGNA